MSGIISQNNKKVFSEKSNFAEKEITTMHFFRYKKTAKNTCGFF